MLLLYVMYISMGIFMNNQIEISNEKYMRCYAMLYLISSSFAFQIHMVNLETNRARWEWSWNEIHGTAEEAYGTSFAYRIIGDSNSSLLCEMFINSSLNWILFTFVFHTLLFLHVSHKLYNLFSIWIESFIFLLQASISKCVLPYDIGHTHILHVIFLFETVDCHFIVCA